MNDPPSEGKSVRIGGSAAEEQAAILRRAQGRFDEALALLARAAAWHAFDRALRTGAPLLSGEVKMRSALGAALALERIEEDAMPTPQATPRPGERE